MIELGNWKIDSLVSDKFPSGVRVLNQVHGSIIVDMDNIENDLRLPAGDGFLISGESGAVAVKTADCMPLVIMTSSQAIGLHISCETLVTGIMDAIPSIINLEKIEHIYIGPHICNEHFDYEYIGEKVRRFMQKFPNCFHKDNGIVYVSLMKAVMRYLEKWKVEKYNMHVEDICTKETGELPSYSRCLDNNEKLAKTRRIYTVVKST